MKKRIVIALLASSLMLAGCRLFPGKKSSNTSDTTSTTSQSGGGQSSTTSSIPVGGDVTIYLNLGEIGLYEGKKGQEYPEMFLENAIKLETKVGAELPGKDKVTSTSGAEFKGWMAYEGEGAPTGYTTAPGFNNKILLANWSGGGDVPPVPPTPGEYTYSCTNLPDWITNYGAVIFAWVWSPNDTGSWKAATFDGTTALHFGTSEELTGFLLVRCAPNTTEPSWQTKGDVAGRIYNQTDNIDCTSGTYSYQCANWKEYNPQ